MLIEALSGAFVARAGPGLCTESVVLRPLAAGPVPVRELWRRARVSKRAMTTMLKAAHRRGLVAVDDAASLLVDPPAVEPATCAPLVELVSRFELEHPHFPVTYGTADQSFTGGPGVDWEPVPREGPADGLPLTALLSQALVAFGIEYERAGRGPIMWAASLVRGDHASMPSGMDRHGVIEGGEPTPLGRHVRDGYAALCANIEESWRARFGGALIDDVIAAVGGERSTFPWVGWQNGNEWAVLASDPWRTHGW